VELRLIVRTTDINSGKQGCRTEVLVNCGGILTSGRRGDLWPVMREHVDRTFGGSSAGFVGVEIQNNISIVELGHGSDFLRVNLCECGASCGDSENIGSPLWHRRSVDGFSVEGSFSYNNAGEPVSVRSFVQAVDDLRFVEHV